MKIIKPPEKFPEIIPTDVSVFLGGSIEMGSAPPWQAEIEALLDPYPGIIFNPRRDDWDSSWEQDPAPGTKFHEQVNWEMEAQDLSDLLVYYFHPDTKSPITLLELGHYLGSTRTPGTFPRRKDILVCCPPTFWRHGNVKFLCTVYYAYNDHIGFLESYDELKEAVVQYQTYRRTP